MDSGVDFTHRMSGFRCLFNLDPPRTRERIKSIHVKLDIELATENDSIAETIAKLNLFTWVEFKLGNYKNAHNHNNDVLKMTEGENITALINQAHLLLRKGEEIRSEDCLNKAENLRQSRQGEELMVDVEAELAYSLSRLGGDDNIISAIDMYTTVVTKKPKMYPWKFGLGLLHRRATHINVTMKNPTKMPVIEHLKLAFDNLKDVAKQSEDKGLKSRAYAQLALMVWQRRCYHGDCKLFDGTNLESLIKNALKHGSKDARILSDCGQILSKTDLDRATRLLEQSLAIKKHSSTYHHLGMCYQKYATFNAKKGTLKKSDPKVDLAKECFQNAINISYGCNIPAIYSLGRLLRACEETDEALKRFNQITHQTSKEAFPKSNGEELQGHHEYLSTVTKAYEQAGYCLLDLAKGTGKTKEDCEILKTKAEQKFLKAISLTATLCNIHPEIKRYEMQIFKAFTILEDQYEETKESPEIIKKYLELPRKFPKS